jgi:hypothetical protein
MNYDKNQKPGQQSQQKPTAGTQQQRPTAPTANVKKDDKLSQGGKTGGFGSNINKDNKR